MLREVRTFHKNFTFGFGYFTSSDGEPVDTLENEPLGPSSSQVGESVQELKMYKCQRSTTLTVQQTYRHVSPANERVRDTGMEGRDADELYRRSERRDDGKANQVGKETCRNGRRREPEDSEYGDDAEQVSRPEGIQPGAEWLVTPRPFSCKPSTQNLEREIDKRRGGKIFAFETLFNHLEGSRFVCNEANLGKQMYNDKELNV